jgi:hypothetical protein
MASKKKELVRRAKALGIDHVGTISELEQRIATAREERTSFSQPFEEEPEPETMLPEPEPEPEPEPAPAPEPKKVDTTPKAHAVKDFGDLQTRIALKTTVKFVGRWYTLRRGKPITAPANVIAAFERAGFVEKK